MDRKLFRIVAACGLLFFLSSQFFTTPAYASWGAAKLEEILGRKVVPAYPLPQQPSDPLPNPVPKPEPKPNPDPVPVPEEPQEPPVVEPVGLSQEEAIMLQLVNQERSKHGLKPLALMPELNTLARMKSRDIIDKNYFSHISPTYGSFAKMVYDAGIRFYSVGENLAKARNATHAFYLFMGSQGHKANILNPNFTHLGLGIVKDQYGVVVTQLFIMKQ